MSANAMKTTENFDLYALFSGELNTLGEDNNTDDDMGVFEDYLVAAHSEMVLPNPKDFEYDFAEFKSFPKHAQTVALEMVCETFIKLHLRNKLLEKTLLFFDGHTALKSFLLKGFVDDAPSEITLEYIALNLAKAANVKLSHFMEKERSKEENKHTLLLSHKMSALKGTLDEQSEIELMEDEEEKIKEAMYEIFSLSFDHIPQNIALIKKSIPLLSIVAFAKKAELYEGALNVGLKHIQLLVES